jgi:hypothetical protein
VNEPTEAELRAFFGPRANYYLAQWHGTARRRYNVAAFLLSGLWLPFRRLYRHALVLWGGVLGLGLVDYVASANLGRPAIPKAVDLLLTFAIPALCAVFANGWYLARAQDAIASVRVRSLPPEQHLAEVAQAGGTRAWHSVAFVVAYVLIVFVVFVLLAMMGLA